MKKTQKTQLEDETTIISQSQLKIVHAMCACHVLELRRRADT